MKGKRRRRALICSRPKGRELFREMLQDSFDLVQVLKACGAEDFVDVAKLPRGAAARALKEMLGR